MSKKTRIPESQPESVRVRYAPQVEQPVEIVRIAEPEVSAEQNARDAERYRNLQAGNLLLALGYVEQADGSFVLDQNPSPARKRALKMMIRNLLDENGKIKV